MGFFAYDFIFLNFNNWLSISGNALDISEEDIKTTLGIYEANTRYRRGGSLDYTLSEFYTDLKADLYPILRQLDLNFFTKYDLLPDSIKKKILQGQKITGHDFSITQKLMAFLNTYIHKDYIKFYALRKIQEQIQWGESVLTIAKIGRSEYMSVKDR